MRNFVYFDVGGTLIEQAMSPGEVLRSLGLPGSVDSLDVRCRALQAADKAAAGGEARAAARGAAESVDAWRRIIFEFLSVAEFAGDREEFFGRCMDSFVSRAYWRVF